MSALRFARPGHPAPTFENGGLVYEGPMTPRALGHRFYLLGEISAPSNRSGNPRSITSLRDYQGPRCGYILKGLRVPCYRPVHADSDHRSQGQLEKAAARKRKR